MDIGIGLNIAGIISLIGSISVWIGLAVQHRKNRADDRASINKSYNELCETLHHDIEMLRTGAMQDRERITALEVQNRELRQENEILKEQILNLQEELAGVEGDRKRLQKEVDNLSTRLAIYETKPTRKKTP